MPCGTPLLCFLKNIKFPIADGEEAFVSQLKRLSSAAARQRAARGQTNLPVKQQPGRPFESHFGSETLLTKVPLSISSQRLAQVTLLESH